MKSLNYNKYDYGIIFTIALLVFGNIGGAYQPIRLVAIFFSISVISRILNKKTTIEQKYVFIFFAFWFFYAILSLFWTSDKIQAIKELVYYYGHFSLFFLIVFWAEKAKKPVISIIHGWSLFFVLGLPVAFIEIITDQHLSYSLLQSATIVNIGHNILVQKKFASLTFGNYNGYVVILVYTLPFLFSNLFLYKKLNKKIVAWFLVFSCSFILITNASRGGVLCLLLVFANFMYFYRKKTLSLLSLFLALACICFYFDSIFDQLFYRFQYRYSFFEDNTRIRLIQIALSLFYESYFMGTGLGSIVSSMAASNFLGVEIPHNLFLEILTQYGIFVFGGFIVFLVHFFLRVLKMQACLSKFVLSSAFLLLIPSSVINSGYLLMPALWVFWGSLFVVSGKVVVYEKK